MFTHKKAGTGDHTHETIDEARKCEGQPKGFVFRQDPMYKPCSGGKCDGSISFQCSYHSMVYQNRYGRAANE